MMKPESDDDNEPMDGVVRKRLRLHVSLKDRLAAAESTMDGLGFDKPQAMTAEQIRQRMAVMWQAIDYSTNESGTQKEMNGDQEQLMLDTLEQWMQQCQLTAETAEGLRQESVVAFVKGNLKLSKSTADWLLVCCRVFTCTCRKSGYRDFSATFRHIVMDHCPDLERYHCHGLHFTPAMLCESRRFDTLHIDENSGVRHLPPSIRDFHAPSIASSHVGEPQHGAAADAVRYFAKKVKEMMMTRQLVRVMTRVRERKRRVRMSARREMVLIIRWWQ